MKIINGGTRVIHIQQYLGNKNFKEEEIMKLNKTARSQKNIDKLFNEDFIWELTEIASEVCSLDFTYPENVGRQKLYLDFDFLEDNKKIQEFITDCWDLYVEKDEVLENIETILNKAKAENKNLLYYPKKDFLEAIKSTVKEMEWASAENGYLTTDEIIELLPVIIRKPENTLYTPITLPKYTIQEELSRISWDTDKYSIDYLLLDLGLQELILNSEMTLSDFWRSEDFNNWLKENNFSKSEFWYE